MICRVWQGWTSQENAAAYDSYLKQELFPRVERELASRGYRGFQVLRLNRSSEVEFMTMLWFDSVESVKGFAGKDYETPVISDKAKRLLAHYSDRCDHYDVSGFRWP
jgi:hypothetical protein